MLYFIILITLLQLIGMIIQNVGKEIIDINLRFRQTLSVFFDIAFLTLFSMIFLQYSIYLHQKVSISILFLCLTVFFIQSLINEKEDFPKILKYITYFLLFHGLFCLSNVLGKKYLDLFIENIYLFLWKIGFFGLIPLLIYDIIVEISSKDEELKYHGIIRYIRSMFEYPQEIYIFLFDLIFGFIWEVSMWLTIYYFTPCHVIISDALAEFLDTIVDLIFPGHKYEIMEKVTFGLLYPIIIFFSLVFNEIIILNFCNLSFNTRYNIMIRQELDKKKSKIKAELYNSQASKESKDDSSFSEEEDVTISKTNTNTN